MRKLLFFHASWCPPCKFFEREFIIPLAAQVAPEKIQKINVQEEPFLAERYGIRRVPAAVLTENERIAFYAGLPDFDKTVEFLRGGEPLDSDN